MGKDEVNVKEIYEHFEKTLGVVPAPLRILGEHAPGVPYAYVSDLDGYLIEL